MASAGEWKDWRNVGQWQIQRNVEEQACQLQAVYKGDGDTMLLLTYTPGTDTANFALGNTGWTSLKEGDDPKVKVDFGAPGSYSDVETNSFVTTDYHWLSMNFYGKQFLTDFALAGWVHVTKGDVVVDKLNLAGSKAAVLALNECALGMNKGIARDPFK